MKTRYILAGSVFCTVAVILVGVLGFFAQAAGADQAAKAPQTTLKTAGPALTSAAAAGFADLALKCIRREYPNKLDHVMNDAGEVRSPRVLHPAFYGCFDWHSCVHAHWLLVRLLKLYPDLPNGKEIRSALNGNLSRANIAAEIAYFNQAQRKSFERTYGWAWLLKLAEELGGWDDPDGRRWSENLTPLDELVAIRLADFLPRQTYPIRTGVHPNTAFALAFALDYARSVGNRSLEQLVIERSRAYFLADRDCPVAWEPGGEDFFSPCLIEADLMRRVLPAREFRPWLERFLPGLGANSRHRLFQPAEVTDRSDPKIAHLDGLNFSRAWCIYGIAATLPPADKHRVSLTAVADRHAAASLPFVASGNYEGEHWLATFAVYMLSERERIK